jgi:hypothetical protein
MPATVGVTMSASAGVLRVALLAIAVTAPLGGMGSGLAFAAALASEAIDLAGFYGAG